MAKKPLPDLSLRVLLKFLENELRERQDESERDSVVIMAASEYHKGRAGAFGEARRMVRKLEMAARSVLKKETPK